MPLKQTVLTVADRIGLSKAARRATAGQLRILCYHGIWVLPGEPIGDCLFVTPEQFERRMRRLKASGFPVLPLGEAVERLGAGDLPEAAVAITIDDGWVSTLTHMVPVLEALELPATLYATTWYAARDLPVVNVAARHIASACGRSEAEGERRAELIDTLPEDERLPALRAYGAAVGVPETWLERRQFHIMSAGELSEARRRGLDIQLHTHRHIDVTAKVDRLPEEVEENRAFLASALGPQEFSHFCYPSGTNHPRAAALLAASGVRSATLCEQGLNPPGADPLALRRLLDGRRVSDAEFDAYLSGMLHFLAPLKALRHANGAVSNG